ncbi:hypothetical protein LP419_01630 [Massilia sp. H-1]|nr:hypothetical protein LP419_01630 [Massilia sp. H-1]
MPSICPRPHEKVLYQVSASQDGASWQRVCPIYLNQRLALIGQDAEHASHAAPGWAFGADGALLLVNDGPQAPIEVHVRPKGAFDCAFDEAQDCYAITGRGESTRLLLKVERVAAPIMLNRDSQACDSCRQAYRRLENPHRADCGAAQPPPARRARNRRHLRTGGTAAHQPGRVGLAAPEPLPRHRRHPARHRARPGRAARARGCASVCSFFGRCRRPAARHHWRQRATGHGA